MSSLETKPRSHRRNPSSLTKPPIPNKNLNASPLSKEKQSQNNGTNYQTIRSIYRNASAKSHSFHPSAEYGSRPNKQRKSKPTPAVQSSLDHYQLVTIDAENKNLSCERASMPIGSAAPSAHEASRNNSNHLISPSSPDSLDEKLKIRRLNRETSSRLNGRYAQYDHDNNNPRQYNSIITPKDQPGSASGIFHHYRELRISSQIAPKRQQNSVEHITLHSQSVATVMQLGAHEKSTRIRQIGLHKNNSERQSPYKQAESLLAAKGRWDFKQSKATSHIVSYQRSTDKAAGGQIDSSQPLFQRKTKKVASLYEVLRKRQQDVSSLKDGNFSKNNSHTLLKNSQSSTNNIKPNQENNSSEINQKENNFAGRAFKKYGDLLPDQPGSPVARENRSGSIIQNGSQKKLFKVQNNDRSFTHNNLAAQSGQESIDLLEQIIRKTKCDNKVSFREFKMRQKILSQQDTVHASSKNNEQKLSLQRNESTRSRKNPSATDSGASSAHLLVRNKGARKFVKSQIFIGYGAGNLSAVQAIKSQKQSSIIQKSLARQNPIVQSDDSSAKNDCPKKCLPNITIAEAKHNTIDVPNRNTKQINPGNILKYGFTPTTIREQSMSQSLFIDFDCSRISPKKEESFASDMVVKDLLLTNNQQKYIQADNNQNCDGQPPSALQMLKVSQQRRPDSPVLITKQYRQSTNNQSAGSLLQQKNLLGGRRKNDFLDELEPPNNYQQLKKNLKVKDTKKLLDVCKWKKNFPQGFFGA